jgi:internalin A
MSMQTLADFEKFSTFSSPYGPGIALMAPWDDEIRAHVAANGIVAIGFDRFFPGGPPTDLSFLAEVPHLLQFDMFVARPDTKLEPIYALTNLRRLIFPATRGVEFDFTRFPGLEACNLFWDKGLASILEVASLKRLDLAKYAARDASGLGDLANLEQLTLQNPKFDSFDGATPLRSLREVFIKSSRCLTSLRGIQAWSGLERLHLSSCTKLTDISAVAGLANLQFFSAEPATIASLRPLAGLTKLSKISLTGKKFDVLDRDLSPLVEIRSLRWGGIHITPWHPHFKPTYHETFELIQRRDASPR